MEMNLDSYEYYYNDDEKVLAKTPVDISKETTNKKISIEYYKNIFKKDFYLFRKQIIGTHVIFDSDSLHKIINKSDGTSVPGFNLLLDFEVLSVSREIILKLSFSINDSKFFKTFDKSKDILEFSKMSSIYYDHVEDNLEDKMAYLLAKLFFDMHVNENEDIEIYLEDKFNEMLDISKPYKYFRLLNEKEVKKHLTREGFK
ncbi:hypothetical protein CPT_MarsHill_127 [Staphylococcus phage MarsHill]|nr:hypothetical protein CPT_MarsHill_127 [Staphylococcus phage MarsHill]QQO92779.1 hypothetical protein CPT_Madawaska_126 [Staphylococcus phage Madawaska]